MMREQDAAADRNHPTSSGKGRLVVVESVYHQAGTGETTLVDSRFGRVLASDEQPYGPRRVGVGTSWQPLDLGWVQDVGMIVIRHEAPARASRPTGAESWPLLEVGFLGENHEVVSLLVIPAGESFRGQLQDLSRWRLRSSGGVVRCSLSVFPR